MCYGQLVMLKKKEDRDLMKELYEKACLVQPGGANITANIKREAANI